MPNWSRPSGAAPTEPIRPEHAGAEEGRRDRRPLRRTADRLTAGSPAAVRGRGGRVGSAMAWSVSVSHRSPAASRCSTRNDRRPTFQRAMPRRSWVTSSASVSVSPSSSPVRATSPGDWA